MRPIRQDKRPNPTEFGQKLHLSVVDGYTYLEQTCWSNFNEGCDLEAAVEDYFRKFGCYPSAVLADRIYRPAGIKCSVPSSASGCPVRRRAAGKPLRQTPKSSARSIGMPVIATPLRDETAKTEAALIILAMNANLRLARRLALFFRSLLSLFLYVVFSAGPMIGGRR